MNLREISGCVSKEETGGRRWTGQGCCKWSTCNTNFLKSNWEQAPYIWVYAIGVV